MNIQISDHFTYKKLLQFTLPSIVMMIFTSIYSVVDGLFVSNFAGKTPFAAINFIMPFLMMLGALGFMVGTGGSAIVSKTLGEGRTDKANEYFSMLIAITAVSGIILAVFGFVFIRPIAVLMGAEGNDMIDMCVQYGRIILVALPAFMLQNVFQSFFVTAEKPQLGLIMTVISGVVNIILDYLFIAVFSWGISGAAIATGISQMIGGIVPVIYFLRKNNSLLQLVKPKFNGKVLLKTCTNGSSELMTNLSLSFVSMLYNLQLMKIIGENGVAAYGVIMYVNFIFTAIFIGYSIGCAPIIGYNYGAENYSELKNMYRKGLTLMWSSGIILTILAVVLAMPLSKIFVGYDKELCSITTRGFVMYSLSFVVMGFNIFGSAFFTALNNGFISAMISFLRTFLFQTLAIMVLPIFLKLDGIWLAIATAEVMAAAVTAVCFATMKKKYHYA